MPLVTTTHMFEKAYEGGYAIGAFNVNNMEMVVMLELNIVMVGKHYIII